MRTNFKTFLLVLFILVSVVIASYFLKEILSAEKQKVEISRNVNNSNIVTLLIKSEKEVRNKMYEMDKDNYTCEFIVYKYNYSDKFIEAFIGFMNRSEEPVNQKAEKSLREKLNSLIFQYMDNGAPNVKYSVLFNPEVEFKMNAQYR